MTGSTCLFSGWILGVAFATPSLTGNVPIRTSDILLLYVTGVTADVRPNDLGRSLAVVSRSALAQI